MFLFDGAKPRYGRFNSHRQQLTARFRAFDTPLKSHRNPKRFRAFEKMSGRETFAFVSETDLLQSAAAEEWIDLGSGRGVYIAAVREGKWQEQPPTWSKRPTQCACVDD